MRQKNYYSVREDRWRYILVMIMHMLDAADKLMCLHSFVSFAMPAGNQELAVRKSDICLFPYMMHLNQVLQNFVCAIQGHCLYMNEILYFNDLGVRTN